MIPHEWLQEAARRIKPYLKHTPLTFDAQENLYLKWENRQVTGSFKARGALNKVLTLKDWERKRGLVGASAGNHGQGLALAGKLVSAPVTIFCSTHAVQAKVEAMQSLGAEVQLVEGGYGQAERAGMAYAAEKSATWVSPYNDGQVIAGQGTVALEILHEMSDRKANVWLVPAGGGGLVAGVGAALKSYAPKSRLIAVQSEASPFLHGLYQRGSQEDVVEMPSLADGLSGPVEQGSITIPLVQRFVDDFILVSEAEIASAIAHAWNRYAEVVEGSAAVPLAAVLSGKIGARPAVILISGGNIQPEVHARLIKGTM